MAESVAECEQRDAGLGDEALHDLVDGLVAVGGLGVPEVFSGGVGVEVCGEVVVDALAEGLFAEVVFDHAEDCSGFAVGDAVEHLVDLAGGFGLGADGAGGLAGVVVEGGVEALGIVLRDIPLGVPFGDGLGLPSRWRSPR